MASVLHSVVLLLKILDISYIGFVRFHTKKNRKLCIDSVLLSYQWSAKCQGILYLGLGVHGVLLTVTNLFNG